MTEDEMKMLEQAQAQINMANTQAQSGQAQAVQQNMNIEQAERSMAQDQLDLSEEKNEIEHLLRGHIIKKLPDGSFDWVPAQNEDEQPLNEYGVRLIMKIVSFYLCKRKLLSNYDEETINTKMLDFTDELSDLIFMKYREMGLDTPEKRKTYSMIVREVQDAVHDVYLRALGGKERDSLRRHLNINENMGGFNQNQQNENKLKMGWLRR